MARASRHLHVVVVVGNVGISDVFDTDQEEQ